MAEQFMPDQIATGVDMLPAPPDLRSTTPAEQPRMLKYYKDPSYFTKNWAPEQVPETSVRALAKAAALAVKQGVLSPALADKLLANSLVEGWHGGPTTETEDAGVHESGKDTVTGYLPTTRPMFGADYFGYDGPDVRQKIAAMGLRVVPAQTAQMSGWAADGGDLVPLGGRDGRSGVGYYPTHANLDSSAKVAALILAHKAQLYGEDKAIERWNGQGPRAQRHAQRVEVMQQMLQHPSNRALLEAYQRYRDEP